MEKQEFTLADADTKLTLLTAVGGPGVYLDLEDESGRKRIGLTVESANHLARALQTFGILSEQNENYLEPVKN